MGTNPKRTVTVQMVPQLAVVDTLSNKEPNANFTKEPNLKLSKVCPKAALTSPDHKRDRSPLTAAPANVGPQARKAASTRGEPVRSPVPTPVPANGNQRMSEHVTGGDRQTPGQSEAGRGVGGAGTDGRDSNANMKVSSPADEKGVCKAGASSAATAPKGNAPTGVCRGKMPSAAEERAKPTASARAIEAEDSNEHASPKNKNLNACESKQTASTLQQDNEGSRSASKHKGAAAPQNSNETDHKQGSSQSSVGLQETPKLQQSTKATPPPPYRSKEDGAGGNAAEKNSVSTLPEEDVQAAARPLVSPEKHQPVCTVKDSAVPQAAQSTPTRAQVAQDTSQSDTAVTGTQQQHSKLYKEASTMTSSPSSGPAKQRHDMEVQAVVNVCSKAVSTSPSLLPFAAARRPSVGAVPREDAMRLTVEADMCPGQNPGLVFYPETLSQEQHARLGAKPKEPGSALCSIQPVYQINIEHSSSRKEQKEAGNSQDSSGLQTSTAKTSSAEAQCLKSGTPPETESGSAALSQAVTGKPNPALPSAPSAAPHSASKTDPAKKKDETSKDARKEAAGKAKTKETSSKKQKVEPERSQEDEEPSEKQKGKSVHDVVWDEQGMTWEVYGASLDPESLGFAIQSHLQCKIKEQERKLIAQTSIRKSVSGSPQNGRRNKRRHQNIFRSMLRNVRRPDCCARPPPSSVLE